MFIETSPFDDMLHNIAFIYDTFGEDNCSVMLVGDLNARTGKLSDFVEDDNTGLVDIDLLTNYYCSDSYLNRENEDIHVNANGRLLIDFLKQSGLKISNGRVCGNKGCVTYVGVNGSSLVDYCLVSEHLLKTFKTFRNLGPNIVSDHCLLEFSILGNNDNWEEN